MGWVLIAIEQLRDGSGVDVQVHPEAPVVDERLAMDVIGVSAAAVANRSNKLTNARRRDQ